MTQTRLFANEFPKRPIINSATVLQRTAELLLPDVIEWLGNESSDGVLDNLIEALSFMDDGYEIAKHLEYRGWIPNAELVEILDGAPYHSIEAYEEEVKSWVKNHDIRLSLKIGDKVRIISKQLDGEIVELDPDMARYTVYVESLGHVRSGTGTHGFLVNFEDVES